MNGLLLPIVFIDVFFLVVDVNEDKFCTMSIEDKSSLLDSLDCSNVKAGKAEELLETLDSCNNGGGIFLLISGIL